MKIRLILGGLLLLFVLSLVSSCHREAQKSLPLVVGSYNIRYANASDSLSGNGWGQRLPAIANMILYHGFDILGTQEGLEHQLKDLEKALPQYSYVGVGRDDGKMAGEHSAIFYKKDVFKLLESGDFWLSETPDVPSVGWDAVLPRICSWGHFKHIQTGQELVFMNLHLDHVGTEARSKSISLVGDSIHEWYRSKKVPIILSGDFNMAQNDDGFGNFPEADLSDAYDISDVRYAANGTFNSFDPDGWTESRIDHIFVTPQVRVLKYGILTDSYWSALESEKISGGDHPSEIKVRRSQVRLPSDHYPVRLEIEVDSRSKE